MHIRTLVFALVGVFAQLLLLNETEGAHLEASGLCLIPVENGRPTEEDLKQSWRLAWRVEILDGVRKPVIYAYNRGGVWTIDEHYAYVPFGGAFPTNFIHDSFVRFPNSGTIIGINPEGLFAISVGEDGFAPLFTTDGSPLRHPYGGLYVERLGGVVLRDSSGLYLLDEQLGLGALAFVPIPDHEAIGPMIDLPDLKGLVIQLGRNVYLRHDDGRTTLLMSTTDAHEYLVSAVVTADGSVRLVTNLLEFAVTLVRDAAGHVTGATAVAAPLGPSIPLSPFEVVTDERTYYWTPAGLWSGQRESLAPVPLPFDVREGYLAHVAAHPQTGELIIFASAGIFALAANDGWQLVPQSERVVSRITRPLGMLTGDRGQIIAGVDSLYLLALRSSANTNECLPALSSHALARKLGEWVRAVTERASTLELQVQRISIDELAVRSSALSNDELIRWGDQAVGALGGSIADRASTLNGASLRILSPYHPW